MQSEHGLGRRWGGLGGKGESLDSIFLSCPLKPPNCGELVRLSGFQPRTIRWVLLVAWRHTNAFSPSDPWSTPSQGAAKTARLSGSRRVGEGGAGADRRPELPISLLTPPSPTGAGAQANPPPPHLRLRGVPWVGSGVNSWPEVWPPSLLHFPATRGNAGLRSPSGT